MFVQRAFELHEEDEAAHSLTSKSMKWDKHKKQIISGKNSVWRTPDASCFSTEKSLNLDDDGDIAKVKGSRFGHVIVSSDKKFHSMSLFSTLRGTSFPFGMGVGWGL